MSEIQKECLDVARKVLKSEVPIKTAEVVQDLHYTGVADKQAENRRFENQGKENILAESKAAMEEVATKVADEGA